jgi:hypothetical protein
VVIALTVQTTCNYYKMILYPDPVLKNTGIPYKKPKSSYSGGICVRTFQMGVDKTQEG